jgi:hypothetical protein
MRRRIRPVMSDRKQEETLRANCARGFVIDRQTKLAFALALLASPAAAQEPKPASASRPRNSTSVRSRALPNIAIICMSCR